MILTEGFYFAERSPDPFDPRKRFPWMRLMHRHPGGEETVVQDFLDPRTAPGIAKKKNLSPHKAAA